MIVKKSLDIAFYGHGEWALNTLKKLNNEDHLNLKSVFSRFPNGDKELEKFCKFNNINYQIEENINEYFNKNKIFYDLGISVSYDQIFKDISIDSHKEGIINCHASKLPDYRGRNILNWALINNESSFGITVHFIDTKIDNGDIIAQKIIDIKFTDDYKDLLSKAYIECPKLILDSVNLIINDEIKTIKQIDLSNYPIYCSKRKEGDEMIDWNNTSLDIYNFIRALVYPGPYAKTIIKGKILFIKKAIYINSAPLYKDIPGSILRKDNNGLLVKTGDSYLLINEWDCDILVKPGDRFNFGTNYC